MPASAVDELLSFARLVPALKPGEEYQRLLAVWHLFFSYEGGQIPEDVIAAAAPRPLAAGTPAGELTWDALVRELFARQRGTAATKADWAGMLTLDLQRSASRSSITARTPT